MSGGLVILVLMGIRLTVRRSSVKPPAATVGHPLLDAIAHLSHIALYALVFLMVATGLATALISDAFAVVFLHYGQPLPATFNELPTRILHGYFAKALIALIALHVGAALYHQFVRGDRLLRRMWFGRRFAAPADDPAAKHGARPMTQATALHLRSYSAWPRFSWPRCFISCLGRGCGTARPP